jgi:hypothetical protein
MQPRQITRATAFEPDALRVIFKAYNDAWSEIAPNISGNPVVVEAARMSLATTMLALAGNADQAGSSGLKGLAVAVFYAKHRIEIDGGG